jgi:two-component system, NarL family, nitrate/nitrite response regulator NarL
MHERICVAVVDDHTRLAGVLRTGTRSSRVRVLGPFEHHDRHLRIGVDVIVVDLDREDGHGLAMLVRVCETAHHAVRVLAATEERDPELGSAIVTAGASGLLLMNDMDDLEDGLHRAVAGELVLPDEHLISLVDRLRSVREERAGGAAIATLTARELQVLDSLAHGGSTGEIAALLGISPATVQSHVKSVLTKLGVHSKVEAVRLAWRCGAIAMPATA